ncbi:MAG TPA: hypothetical protein VN721_09095 [Flavipsychrobacter sp.]|nr:hypothetical protein [Flavipsychrobacter sp.]
MALFFKRNEDNEQKFNVAIVYGPGYADHVIKDQLRLQVRPKMQ